MRKILFTILLLAGCFAANAQGFNATYSQPANNIHQVSFNIEKWSLQEVVLNGVTYNTIVFDNSTVTEKKGWAELPFISASIQLPSDKNVDITISNSDYKDYDLSYPLVPSRGVIYRNQNPSEIAYSIDPASLVDEFYPLDLAKADDPFIIRDVRGTAVRVFPFQYNAATNTLRVYSNVVVDLTENSETPTNPLVKENLKPVREMIGVYESLFLNFNRSRYDLTMPDFGELLVISTERDQEALQPYIQWKKQKGFIVHEQVVATGTNVQSLIQESYNNNNNILYVQLIGDWAEIKGNNSVDNSPCDPKMGCVVGTDNFPEIAVGRFSCSTPNQLTVQINKAINYEQNPDTTPGWLDAFCGIGSNEGPGDDNEIDNVHIQNIYEERLQANLNYSTVYQCYGNPSSSQVSTAVNSGVSTIAYCGHGSETSWVTSGFNNSNVNSLNNGNKLPFIVSVACNNGTFQGTSDCFAEAWLKKENGGAVVTWMSSISQPWNPPMRGEDYFYDVLGGGFDYSQYPGQNGINTTEQRTTWGAVTVNTLNLMLTESQNYDDIETAHTWCTFGDVTLQLRTQLPKEIAASDELMLIGVPFTTTITSPEGPVANALVCLSKDGEYYTGITDETGTVTIEHNILPGEVNFVVTAFNTTTINKTINCIAPEGPYLLYFDYSVAGDGFLSYGKTSDLDVAIRNVGVDNADNTVVTIASEDPYITFNVSESNFGTILAGDTLTLDNAFTLTVSGNVPDNYVALCTLTMNCGGEQWTAELSLPIIAPKTELVSFGVEGELLPGKTLNITTSFKNTGSMPVYNSFGVYTQTSPYVTVITTDPVQIGNIENDGTIVTAAFTISVSADAPFGTIIPSTVTISGDNNFSFEASFEPFIDICNVAVSSYPYNEGFEDVDLPNCWTQEIVSGEGSEWITRDGGVNFHPYHAHTGEFNACASGDNDVIRLVSPLINLNGSEDPTLHFWHAQSVNNSKQDKLRVYYKNSTDGEWILLAQYNFSIAAWKQREIALPNTTANYYIAFEAECNGGYGVVLDDVSITVSGTSEIKGDSNGDGVVNITDLMTNIAFSLGENPDPFIFDNGDFNSDGLINILDVIQIANFIIHQ